MKIDINENWAVWSEGDNFVLGKKSARKNKEGEKIQYLIDKTYHHSFDSVFQSYMLKRCKSEEGIREWEQLRDLLEEIKGEIKLIRKKFSLE